MSLVSDLHAPLDVSSSPGFVAVRGESKADAVASPHSIATAIPSPEPAVLIPNRRELSQDSVPSSTGGNASDAADSESGNKPAWGMTANGDIDTAPVVLGGSSFWPALSESAKASTKPSFDGSASALVSNSLPMRGDGNSGDDVGTSGSFSMNWESSSSSSTSSSAEMSQNITDKQTDKRNYNNWDHRPRESRGWVDQGDRRRRHGGSSRRGSYGSRRDEDRVVRDWNSYRPPSVRDSHMQGSHPSLPVMRPHMPAMVPFFGPFPLYQHFPGPMAYPDIQPHLYFFPTYPHPEVFGGYPFVPHPAPLAIQEPIFFTSAEQKRILILKQIEYYFSQENLCTDLFLKSKMDNHGWVPIHVIATFNRIKLLTNSIPFILDAIRPSDVLEVEGNRVRKRDGWQLWISEECQNECNTESEPNSENTTNPDSLVSQMESFALDQGNTHSA